MAVAGNAYCTCLLQCLPPKQRVAWGKLDEVLDTLSVARFDLQESFASLAEQGGVMGLPGWRGGRVVWNSYGAHTLQIISSMLRIVSGGRKPRNRKTFCFAGAHGVEQVGIGLKKLDAPSHRKTAKAVPDRNTGCDDHRSPCVMMKK
eukprot:4757401-Amphidinium_carterae.1